MNYVPFFLALALTAPLATHADWEQTYLAPSKNAAMRPHAQGYYDDAVDKTFLVHGDSNLDAWVTAYDHAAEDWIPSVRVAGNFHDDNYHNYPVITRDAQGYIHVFIGRGNLTHTRSLQPRDLQSGWTDEVILKNSNDKAINSSYPLPILAENGDLYLFFRTAAHGGNPIHFIKTSDNGATWTDQRHVIEHDPRRADQSSNLYLMGIEHVPASNGLPERILLCWINAGPGADGKGGYNSARKDVFFAVFNVSDELLYAADGTALGDVIRDDEAEAHCKVYDSGPLGEDRAGDSGWYKVDDFDRGDATTVGGDWNEGGSAGFAILDQQLLVQGGGGSLHLDLPLSRQIREGVTGTLFFQVTAPSASVDESMAFGIVDQAPESGFSARANNERSPDAPIPHLQQSSRRYGYPVRQYLC